MVYFGLRFSRFKNIIKFYKIIRITRIRYKNNKKKNLIFFLEFKNNIHTI